MKTLWKYILLILSLIGAIDSGYLLAEHYGSTSAFCAIGSEASIFSSCNAVTTSSYSIVFGIPVSLIGVVYYLIVTMLVFALFRFVSRKLIGSIVLLTGIGFLWSIWFVYVQLFILEAICIYCMLSALTTALLFFISIVCYLKIGRE